MFNELNILVYDQMLIIVNLRRLPINSRLVHLYCEHLRQFYNTNENLYWEYSLGINYKDAFEISFKLKMYTRSGYRDDLIQDIIHLIKHDF